MGYNSPMKPYLLIVIFLALLLLAACTGHARTSLSAQAPLTYTATAPAPTYPLGPAAPIQPAPAATLTPTPLCGEPTPPPMVTPLETAVPDP